MIPLGLKGKKSRRSHKIHENRKRNVQIFQILPVVSNTNRVLKKVTINFQR